LDALGFRVAPRLAKLLDLVAAHETNEIGPLSFFPIDDVLPAKGDAFSFMLAQPFRVDAMMMHALPLGTTAAGDVWMVSLAGRRGRHDVFLFGHETDSLTHVADSVEAFALAVHLADGESAPTAAQRRALVGHVANCDDLELAWLGRKRLPKTSSPTPKLCAKSADLRSILNVYGSHRPKPAAELASKPLPAEAIDAMIRAFLRVEDARLARYVERFREAPSGLVRDAVEHLERLTKERGRPTFDRRLAALLRPAKKAAATWRPPSPSHETIDEVWGRANAAQARGKHREAVTELQKGLALSPKNARAWAALCYSLSCLERWAEMRDAAEHAVACDPQSSYAYLQLACAHVGLEDYAGSIGAARRAVALDPKDGAAAYNLALGLLMTGDAEGRAVLERALRLAPELRSLAESDADVVSALAALDELPK
jgi:tetratricopeptide (TPR) repeat protein